MRHLETAWNIVRDSGRKYGPYLLLEAIMPGGTLLAVALWLYQRHSTLGFPHFVAFRSRLPGPPPRVHPSTTHYPGDTR